MEAREIGKEKSSFVWVLMLLTNSNGSPDRQSDKRESVEVDGRGKAVSVGNIKETWVTWI